MKTEPSENAFPVNQSDTLVVREWGLTKREYFAVKILQGLITGVRASGDSLNIKELTQSALMITDEFINELNK